VDAHRPLTAKDDLARVLTWQEARTISKNLAVQFENMVYQIQTERPTYTMRNAAVTVCVDAKQNITLLYKGKSLQGCSVLDSKGLSPHLQGILERKTVKKHCFVA